MKRILRILILLPVFANAQNTASRYSIGLWFSNDLCSRISKAEGSVAELKERFDSLENVTYGYAVGLVLRRSMQPNLYLETGLNYSDRGYAIDTISEVSLTKVRFHYRYLELPLRAVYVFSAQRRTRPFVSLGCSFGYLLQSKTTFIQIGQATEPFFDSLAELSRFSVGLSTSMGIEKSINEEYKFGIEIQLRQAITSISDSPLERKLNSLGLCISFTRKL